MATEIQRADLPLRRATGIVLGVATLAAVVVVLAFDGWITRLSTTLPAAQLIGQLYRWTTIALTASGLCLLLLAGYAARLARLVGEQRRWPLRGARVLRDTPIRRDAAATDVARRLRLGALLMLLLALVVGVFSGWLFLRAH